MLCKLLYTFPHTPNTNISNSAIWKYQLNVQNWRQSKHLMSDVLFLNSVSFFLPPISSVALWSLGHMVVEGSLLLHFPFIKDFVFLSSSISLFYYYWSLTKEKKGSKTLHTNPTTLQLVCLFSDFIDYVSLGMSATKHILTPHFKWNTCWGIFLNTQMPNSSLRQIAYKKC